MPETGIPTVYLRVVVGAIEGPRFTDRFEKIHTPQGPTERDGLRRVDRTCRFAPLEGPDLQSHPSLRALLARSRVRIEKVEVRGDDHHVIETESVEHVHFSSI
jgi:hypothetical protein